ncbi:hypothetical protein [Providencia sp. PROV252]|uniref:hypothetical protein n=1 Tax=Providencia sp. PROV252 TaxID=2936799 RepID=UPI00298F54DB|nr:hypothetical protein [Providencia sp. PROV252]
MKGKLTISRPTYGDGRELISVVVRDGASRINFLEIEINYSDFTKAITGLSEVDCELTIRGLEQVGKKKITEARTALCPSRLVGKDAYENWLKENKQEEGWKLDAYLGSKGSVEYTENGVILNYQVIKFVDISN